MKKISCFALISLFCLSSIISPINSYSIEKGIYNFENSSRSGPMNSPWPMHGYDKKHTGLSPFSTQNNTGVEKWRFLSNFIISCDPVIDNDGNIYFISGLDTLYAITSEGKLKWKFELLEIQSCTPAIAEDGTIYIAYTDWINSPYHDYICAITSDGKLKWKYLVNDFIISHFTIADDGTIYFGTIGDILFGEYGGRIYAINPDGNEKWSYETKHGYSIRSTPAVDDDGMIYCSDDDGYCYSFYPNGTLRWQFDAVYECYGDPAIGMNNTVYFGSDFGIHALNSETGELKWEINAFQECPSIDNDGTIYVIDYESVLALNQDGTIKWQYSPGKENDDQPSTKPAISSDGTIYIGISAGNPDCQGAYLVAVNSRDGTEKWRKVLINYPDRGGWTWSSPAIGKDGTVYIGTYVSDLESFGWLFAICDGVEDTPPSKPLINGPTSGYLGENYEFTIYSTDPEGEDISYYVEWEPSSLLVFWYGPYKSGETITVNHTWETYVSGEYIIKVIARDTYGMESEHTDFKIHIYNNYPPSQPSIEGRRNGDVGSPYTYTFTSNDPEGHDISYYIKWGDGSTSTWSTPLSSGNSYLVNHTWSSKGTYTIEAKAKDIKGAESEWATLTVTMPYSYNKSIPQFLKLLFEHFPNVFPILRQLLGY